MIAGPPAPDGLPVTIIDRPGGRVGLPPVPPATRLGVVFCPFATGWPTSSESVPQNGPECFGCREPVPNPLGVRSKGEPVSPDDVRVASTGKATRPAVVA